MKKKVLEEIHRIKFIISEQQDEIGRLADPVPMPNYISNFDQWRQGGRWGKKGYHHKGDDISVPSGTQVKSPWSGKILVANLNYNDKCGGTVDIDHGNGYFTRFCHLKQIDVSKGDIVKRGQVVGLSGGMDGEIGAGNSKGAHLHWTLKKNGKAVDPMEHLKMDIAYGEYDKEGIEGVYAEKGDVSDSDEQKLLDKILETEYLGKKVKDWLDINFDEMSFLEYFFTVLKAI